MEPLNEKKGDVAAPQYINTPFAYTRTQRGLTLLQQQIMMRVSAHLQGYLQKFFKDGGLVMSPERPKPIMSAADLEALPPVRINLSEMGISSTVYSRLRDALKKVLSLTIDVGSFDAVGRPVRKTMFLFSSFELPVTEKGTTVKMKVSDDFDFENVSVDRLRGYVDISLNKDAVFTMFDMAQGYVTHPENIARIGKVDNMPLMYYLVRHKMQNFKLNKAQITPNEIREYLGYITHDPIDYKKITRVQFAQYSRLRERVIKVALDDIRRVYDNGQIDFYFDFIEVRPKGRVRGEPSYVEFSKVGTSKREEERKRKNSQRLLAKNLIELYPTLDERVVNTFSEQVSDALWPDFKAYAYNGLIKAIEQPHRWAGSHEDFVYHLLSQWVRTHKEPKRKQSVDGIGTDGKTRKAKKEEAQQPDLFNQPPAPPEPVVEDYPGRYADEWQELLRRYTGALRPWLAKARHYGASQAGFMSVRFADRRTLDEFNAECQKPQNKETYGEMMRILAELIGKPAARVLVRGVDER